jgi:hypothetical protein
MTEEEIVDAVGAMGVGGSWAPDDCKARHSVCIIIPYRDRKDHLWTLLYRLIPVLKRQQLDFKIFVVEQVRITIMYYAIRLFHIRITIQYFNLNITLYFERYFITL